MRKTRPAEDRFWEKVAKVGADECWLWTGSRSALGYGNFFWEGRKDHAHRYAYAAFVGPIPEGYQLDHLCRNPPCVNPAHLEPVTHRENVLRGVSPTAVNAAKTHCVHGHQLSGDNLVIYGTRRKCRTCSSDQGRRRWVSQRKGVAENPERRSEIARNAARVRWDKRRGMEAEERRLVGPWEPVPSEGGRDE